MRTSSLVGIALVFLAWQAFGAEPPSKPLPPSSEFKKVVRDTEPLSPQDELRTFRVPPGFEVELVTAEPDIDKPMNMAFDSRGRLWVTSSREYPIAATSDRKPLDTLRVLEDTNGDGHYDSNRVFADGLNIPIGVYPYRDGAICFSIPDILWLRDTDGDGRADVRKKLFGPFDTSRDTHGMCNAFRRGYDGWLYSAHGFNNRSEVTGADGNHVSLHSGNTFRIRLDGSRIEHYTHGLVNPFGLAFDDHGDLFVADCHTKPINLLIRDGYYDSFGKPHDGLGYVPNVMEHLHGSTAIGGIVKYHAESFPAEYRGNTFHGNVMTSRINRNKLVRNGSSYQAREQPDFLICSDPWFRPVDLQVGPDGAMYVADFYNRIIGHYEVGLDHPGRDRRRGRIWRIKYTGKLPADGVKQRLAVGGDIDATIAELASPNLTRRMLAMDRLTDHFGSDCVPQLRTTLRDKVDGRAGIHAMWVLHRLGKLADDELLTAITHPKADTRLHAFRVLAATESAPAWSAKQITAGLQADDQLVPRAAAEAAARHLSQELIQELLKQLHFTSDDVHLRYVLRMALRNHLRNADWFRELTASIKPRKVNLVAQLCLSLKTAAAGEFLVRRLEQLDISNTEAMTAYIKFAVQYVSGDTVNKLARVARQQFAGDVNFQLELLKAARQGLDERGDDAPAAIRNWASHIAGHLLGVDANKPGRINFASEPAWSFAPHPGTKHRGNPFQLTRTRKSSDGQSNTPLISSFPNGETWTGIYRSATFKLSGPFSFYLAGHDGFPDKPANQKNSVRLRDANTHQVLHTWWPPRNDTAQRMSFNLDRELAVYIEMTDGDDAGAYAWLAAGRFSVPELNLGDSSERYAQAAQLIGDFKLEQFRKPILQSLPERPLSRDTAVAFGVAFAKFDPTGHFAAAALVPGVLGATPQLRSQSLLAVLKSDMNSCKEVIGKAMQVSTAVEQSRLAEQLCNDAGGAELLVNIIEQGHASARLLTRSAISERMKAIGNKQLATRIAAATAKLPDENEQLIELIAARKKSLLTSGGSIVAGAQLFEKKCGVCHQVAGKGKKVGPNLDGIGGRGLDRLTEDILLPNRNVDVAFRSTTVVTTVGKVYNGLAKVSGTRVIVVDNAGREHSIPIDDIDEQIKSTRSAMPDNLGEALTDEEFRNLLTYLMSLSKVE